MVALVLPVTCDDGAPAVLKLQWPHRESEHEAVALAAWSGNGAVRLLRHDPRRHALLLERCEPGTSLAEATLDEAISAMVELHQRLAIPAPASITTIAEESSRWAGRMPVEWEQRGRPCERELVDRAVELVRDLLADPRDPVLAHQDLHGENVLRASRMPWLAIDPKPLAADRDFAVIGLLRSWTSAAPDAPMLAFGGPHDLASIRRRVDGLVEGLGVGRERVLAWAFVQSIAWCFDSAWIDQHLQTARWLLEA